MQWKPKVFCVFSTKFKKTLGVHVFVVEIQSKSKKTCRKIEKKKKTQKIPPDP